MKQSVINALAQRIAFCRVMADKSAENYVIYRIAADQLMAVADMLEIYIEPDLISQHIKWYRDVLQK